MPSFPLPHARLIQDESYEDRVHSDPYQAVVELVVIRIRVRVAPQLSNLFLHLLLHHPRYRALRLRAQSCVLSLLCRQLFFSNCPTVEPRARQISSLREMRSKLPSRRANCYTALLPTTQRDEGSQPEKSARLYIRSFLEPELTKPSAFSLEMRLAR